jgi:lysophospholipase L1-like esterase
MTASDHAQQRSQRFPLPERGRHEAKLLEASSRPVQLVLLGDSITVSYELKGPEWLRDYSSVWQRYYADRDALNLGLSGDGTRHLLWRIIHGEIDSIAPKVEVILIGTNDIGWLHRTAADTVAGIEAVVAELHLRLPATKILLVGLLPSDRSLWVQQATAEINSALAAHYGNGQVPYVTFRDVSPVLLKSSVLDTHFSATLSKSRRSRLCTLLRKDRNIWLLRSSRR